MFVCPNSSTFASSKKDTVRHSKTKDYKRTLREKVKKKVKR